MKEFPRLRKTSLSQIRTLRHAYFNSMPEFQELYLELMVRDSDIYSIQSKDHEIGYAIRSKEGVLIEFYLNNQSVERSRELFRAVISELSITDIYCKSFDSQLFNICQDLSFPNAVIGVLYRDHSEEFISRDHEIEFVQADVSHEEMLLSQDESIQELFETSEELKEFSENELVYSVYKYDELIGCGMIIRTHQDFPYCDLGVWTKAAHRGQGYGAQIIMRLREFAVIEKMIPSCGCSIDNIASQRTIEKSGYKSKHSMLHFKVK